MKKNEEVKKEELSISRRSFIKAVTAATGAGILAGCSPKEAETAAPVEASNESLTGESTTSESTASAAKTWRDAPDPITDISETVEADVVVVGAGTGGVCATLAAVQGGAKTVCIQKGPMVLTHGGNFGALNSRFQQEIGNPEIDLLDLANHHIRYNNHRPAFDFVKEIMLQSAETLEWIFDETGIPWNVRTPQPETYNNYPYNQPTFATGHITSDPLKAIGLANAIADRAMEEGAEFYFNTPGEQLVQDSSGRVTGVIAKNADGQYIQFNAAKGVILATGDYGSDYEMCEDLCPWVVGTHNYYAPNYNTGDGHKMGYWVGGMMETAPHTKMAHIHNCIDGTNLTDSPIKSNPFLWVNQEGNRFVNEEMEYAMVCNAVREQPGQVFYIVLDSNYAEQSQNMWNAGRGPVSEEAFSKAIELGYIVQGDTLEEIAAAFDIPADAFTATVDRYNTLVDAGYDEDFGKPSADLHPIAEGPFYLVRTYTPMDVTMGGLMIDLNMHVVDNNDAPIPGLYAVGNTSGGFYGGTDYDLEVDAFSLGRAVTTGRLAGEYAAAGI